MLLLTACGLGQTTLPFDYGTPQPVCVLADPRIREASGLAASRRHPGLYYVHNDSGDRPVVYLLDRAGQTRAIIELSPAQAVDFEDIALAPGSAPGTFDVCVADIGDNEARRASLTVYRFAEPDLPTRAGDFVSVRPTAYRFHYPDGPTDAEGFAVQPATGHGYIFTKRLDGQCSVYRLPAPWNAERETALERIAALDLPSPLLPLRIVTAADISPDGRRLAIRCVVGGWEWRLASGAAPADFEDLFRAAPTRLELAAERQGEALAYSADGQALLTVGEGTRPTLFESVRPPDEAARVK